MQLSIDSNFRGITVNALAGILVGIVICLQPSYLRANAPQLIPNASKQPNPLTQAANEFKILTRAQGISPTSSPLAQRRHKPKWPWHGRLFEYFRNDALDAIPHQVKQNGQTISPLHRNHFGFDISGPLLIPHLIRNPNNTFFTLTYDGVREDFFQASLHTIPTAAQRVGDYSQVVDPSGQQLPIYDPATTAPNPAYHPSLPVSTTNLQYLRSQFPGNIIPQNRLSPAAVEALRFYPEPNTHVGPFNQNNYFVNSPELDNADGFHTNIDHTIGTRNQLTGNATVSNGLLAAPPYFPTIATPTTPPQHFSFWRSTLNYTYTASARTVNTASLTLASNVTRASFGSETPFPDYDFQGTYLSMGVAYPTSRDARNTSELGDNLSIHAGKHSLAFSVADDQYQVNTLDPEYPSGYFQFGPGLTSLPGIPDTGDPIASVLLGLPQLVERTITISPSYFRDSYQSLAASDQYQARKNLSLHFDLTFSRRTPRAEKYNRQSTVDPSVNNLADDHLGALVFADRNGIPRGLRPTNYDLDPSASLAWNPRGSSKTIVRASFSRHHEMIPIYNDQFGTQGFDALQTFSSANTDLTPALGLTTGIPPYTQALPDLSPSAADSTVADFIDMSNEEPVYRSASLSVERDFPFSLMTTAGFAYKDGYDILVGNSATDPEAVNPRYLSYGDPLYNTTFRQSLSLFPQYLDLDLDGLYPAGSYQRVDEYIRVEKGTSHGLFFTFTYEHSRQFDDYSAPNGNQYLLNLPENWAPSSYNPPQFFQASYTYKLPFGPNESFLHFYGWKGQIVRGWSVYGTAYWNGGTPLSMYAEYNLTGDVVPTLFADVVPGVNPHVAHPSPLEWFNSAAFTNPPNFTLGDGTATEPNLLGPGYNDVDLSLNKRFPMGGSRVLEFSATAYNLTNHGNWNTPGTGIGTAAAPNVDAGRIIGSTGQRIIELELEVDF